MKIGMICPYSFDVPGGVQAHVWIWRGADRTWSQSECACAVVR